MRTALFDFELPPDRIALRPVSPRDAARLLVVRPGQVPEREDRGMRDLPALLRAGDALVVNDTKVIAARLRGRRIGRGVVEPAIEVTLHKTLPYDPAADFAPVALVSSVPFVLLVNPSLPAHSVSESMRPF